MDDPRGVRILGTSLRLSRRRHAVPWGAVARLGNGAGGVIGAPYEARAVPAISARGTGTAGHFVPVRDGLHDPGTVLYCGGFVVFRKAAPVGRQYHRREVSDGTGGVV